MIRMGTEIEQVKPARVGKRAPLWVVRRAAARLINQAPHLANPAFKPLIFAYVRSCLLLERSYAVLGSDVSLLDDKGELRASLDTCRRLSETVAKLAKALCISPETLKTMRNERLAETLESLRAGSDEAEEAEEVKEDGGQEPN
jgi:hypothetical protein